jgi:hypothetical protein
MAGCRPGEVIRPMDALLQQLQNALGGFAADPRVSLGAHVVVGYAIALWLACALWAFVDMRRRSGSLIAPYVTATVVVLASPLLFPLALLLHVVVRPRVPIAERRLARLREAALESDVELPTCPVCRRPVDPAWLLCPRCRTALAHLCDTCGRTAPIEWGACAWCGATFDPPQRAVRTGR